MHRLSRWLLTTLFAFAVTTPAAASTLALNSGTLSLTIGALPPVSLAAAPTSISVSSGAGTFTEPASVFGPTNFMFSASQFTGIPQISGLTLAGFGNGTKVCTQTGPIGCAGGLVGGALVNVLQLFNLTVPLSAVGSPGASVQTGVGAISITVLGQGWTAGTQSVTGVTISTPGGGITTVFSTNGTDQRTPGHGGSLVLVSAAKVITNVAGNFPTFAIQTLDFAPPELEPTSIGVSKTADLDGGLVTGTISITNVGENPALISAIEDTLEVHFPRKSDPPPLPEGSTPNWFEVAEVPVPSPGFIEVGETVEIDYSFDLCLAEDFAGANSMRNVVVVTLANKPEKAKKDTVETRSDSFQPQAPEECAVPCAHDKCVTGIALDPSCDPCVASICAVDPFCCAVFWDGLCVSEVASVCGLLCP